jgi:hypothetical protein
MSNKIDEFDPYRLGSRDKKPGKGKLYRYKHQGIQQGNGCGLKEGMV